MSAPCPRPPSVPPPPPASQQPHRGAQSADHEASCCPWKDEEAWAIAFSVPTATPGLKLLCSDYLASDNDPWTRPISSQHKMVETLTVFADVFVPGGGRPNTINGKGTFAFLEKHLR